MSSNSTESTQFQQGCEDALHGRPKKRSNVSYLKGYQDGEALVALHQSSLRWYPNTYEDPNDPETRAINETIARRLSSK